MEEMQRRKMPGRWEREEGRNWAEVEVEVSAHPATSGLALLLPVVLLHRVG
jgi:hypothetical protein